ncbi:MAG TPA: hypothetical protein PK867_13595 [Pirellulales bacterium]|nr:hypothetical protein [Pirellulales bacterium]
MYSDPEMAEYLKEIREQVCTRCIEKPPGGPPCAPLGKQCGIELDLPQLVDAVHGVYGIAMDPYVERFHDSVCSQCPGRNSNQCPCPLDCLLLLAVQAIETVDERRRAAATAAN